MKIKKIISQNRRDMDVIYECEHCEFIHGGYAYDDANFHNNVIPTMQCLQCGKTSGENYRPLTTKYAEGEQI